MLKARSEEAEIIDDPGVDPAVLKKSLEFMAFVNRFLGGADAVLRYLARCGVPEKFTLLDVACGGGDIAAAVVRWARKNGKEASVTAIDLNPSCLAHAKARFGSLGIRFLRHSAFDLEALGPFDFIMSSMFFHHLSDADITRLLVLFERQSRRGFLVNDLYRGYLNYAGAALLSSATLNGAVIHDATVSVKRAFDERDCERYRKLSGTSLEVRKVPVFRITMGRPCQPS